MRMKSMAPSPIQRSEGGSVCSLPPYLSLRIPVEERAASTTSSLSLASIVTPLEAIMTASNTAPIGRISTMPGGLPPYMRLRIPRNERGDEQVPPMPSSAVATSPSPLPVPGRKSTMPPYLVLRIPRGETPPSPPPPMSSSKTQSPVSAPWLSGNSVGSAADETKTKTEKEKVDLKSRLPRTKSIGLPRNPRPVRKGGGRVPGAPELPGKFTEGKGAEEEKGVANTSEEEIKEREVKLDEKIAKEKEKAEKTGSDASCAKARMAQMANMKEEELGMSMEIEPKARLERLDDSSMKHREKAEKVEKMEGYDVNVKEKQQQTERVRERQSGVISIGLRSSTATPVPEVRQELRLRNGGTPSIASDKPKNRADLIQLERSREVDEKIINAEGTENSSMARQLTVKKVVRDKLDNKQLPMVPSEQGCTEAPEREEMSGWSNESDMPLTKARPGEWSSETTKKEVDDLEVAKVGGEDRFPRTPGSYFSPRQTCENLLSNEIDTRPGSLLQPGVEAAWMQESLSPLPDMATYEEEREMGGMQPSPLRISGPASIEKEIEAVRTMVLSMPLSQEEKQRAVPSNQHQRVESSSFFSAPSSASRTSILSQDSRDNSVVVEQLILHLLSLPSTERRLYTATRSSFLTVANQGTLTMITLRIYAVQDRAYLCSELRLLALLLANLVVPHEGAGGQSLSKRLMDWIMARMMKIRQRVDMLEGLIETISKESGDYLDQQVKEVCLDGTKMFKSLYEAIGTEIEGRKRSVLVGLVMIWGREKTHLESNPPPTPSKHPESQDFITRKFLPASMSEKSSLANDELKTIIDEIWSQRNSIPGELDGKERRFVERRDLKRSYGGGHTLNSSVGEMEVKGIEDIFGMVLDIQARFWADLVE